MVVTDAVVVVVVAEALGGKLQSNIVSICTKNNTLPSCPEGANTVPYDACCDRVAFFR